MTTANPLQELAEKLRKLTYVVQPGVARQPWDKAQTVTITAYSAGSECPLLTEKQIAEIVPVVGTLLQAERAATYQRVISHVAHMEQLASNSYSKSSLTTVRERIDEWLMESPEAASALSAVVQRDTEKLRELLHRAHGCVKALQIEAKRDGYTLAEVNRLSDDIKAALQ